MTEEKRESVGKRLFRRYGLDALSAMGLGLFATLIIGLIIEQFARIPGFSMLSDFAQTAQSPQVVGAGIGVAIAWGLKAKPLAIFSSAVAGALGNVAGGPLGCYVTAVLGAEAGNFIAGKTPLDIVLIPLVTILVGGLVAKLTGPGVMALMRGLMSVIDRATTLQPIPMGIIVSVIVGLALTAPISSAALCAMIFTPLGEEGLGMGLQLAAGAATVGCCAQMVGFAIMSFRDNGWGGLISIGLGTSMLQVPNILRRPWILLPPTLAATVLGPFSTTLFAMRNVGAAAGMGTSGLVGQFGTWSAMAGSEAAGMLLFKMLLLHLLLPGLITYGVTLLLRQRGLIRNGDLALQKL